MGGIWADLRARCDPAAVIGARWRLKREGGHWVARCPFHPDGGRPNLVLFPDGGFRCFACGARGDVFDLVAKLDGVSLAEAVARVTAGVAAPASVPPAPARTAAAPVAQRDAVYRALLAACPLAASHRAQLRARGLSDAAIAAAGYGTWPGGFGRDVAARLQAAGLDLAGVPGFARDKTGGWWIRARAGLLIPVRDAAGRIHGCQIRTDEATRYRWLSSAGRPGGASPGSPAHVAGRTSGRPGGWVWVTEGPLKADVAATLLRAPVVGVPGVTSWRAALPALADLAPGVVVLAFDRDADPGTRAAVQQAAARLARALARRGLPVRWATWSGAKGVDDVLAAGGTVRVRLHPDEI